MNTIQRLELSSSCRRRHSASAVQMKLLPYIIRKQFYQTALGNCCGLRWKRREWYRGEARLFVRQAVEADVQWPSLRQTCADTSVQLVAAGGYHVVDVASHLHARCIVASYRTASYSTRTILCRYQCKFCVLKYFFRNSTDKIDFFLVFLFVCNNLLLW